MSWEGDLDRASETSRRAEFPFLPSMQLTYLGLYNTRSERRDPFYQGERERERPYQPDESRENRNSQLLGLGNRSEQCCALCSYMQMRWCCMPSEEGEERPHRCLHEETMPSPCSMPTITAASASPRTFPTSSYTSCVPSAPPTTRRSCPQHQNLPARPAHPA